jgi:hypothetical protein
MRTTPYDREGACAGTQIPVNWCRMRGGRARHFAERCQEKKASLCTPYVLRTWLRSDAPSVALSPSVRSTEYGVRKSGLAAMPATSVHLKMSPIRKSPKGRAVLCGFSHVLVSQDTHAGQARSRFEVVKSLDAQTQPDGVHPCPSLV